MAHTGPGGEMGLKPSIPYSMPVPIPSRGAVCTVHSII